MKAIIFFVLILFLSGCINNSSVIDNPCNLSFKDSTILLPVISLISNDSISIGGASEFVWMPLKDTSLLKKGVNTFIVTEDLIFINGDTLTASKEQMFTKPVYPGMDYREFSALLGYSYCNDFSYVEIGDPTGDLSTFEFVFVNKKLLIIRYKTFIE